MKKFIAYIDPDDGILSIEYMPGLNDKELVNKLKDINNIHEMSVEMKDELLLKISKKLFS